MFYNLYCHDEFRRFRSYIIRPRQSSTIKISIHLNKKNYFFLFIHFVIELLKNLLLSDEYYKI